MLPIRFIIYLFAFLFGLLRLPYQSPNFKVYFLPAWVAKHHAAFQPLLWQGLQWLCISHFCFIHVVKYSREPIFAFAFEGALFVFEYRKPQFAPLFALPPKKTPRHCTTLLSLIFYSRLFFHFSVLSCCVFRRGRLAAHEARSKSHLSVLVVVVELRYKAKPRANPRIRMRGSAVRVRIQKTATRPIIRITTEKDPT